MIEYNVGQFDFRALGKAQAIGHIQGFIKVLADNEDKIVGASIVGPHATDLLTELSLSSSLRINSRTSWRCYTCTSNIIRRVNGSSS